MDSRVKLGFWLRQLVKFTKMKNTERGIDFVGRMGRLQVIFGYTEFGILVVNQVKMSNI